MEVDSSAASSSQTPLSWIEHKEASSPAELKSWFTKIREQYERKLWHNLTVTLLQFIYLPEAGPHLIELWNNFIHSLEDKANRLRLMEIARRVGREFTEPELTLKFLREVLERIPSPYPTEATESTPAVAAAPRPMPEAYCLNLSSIAYAQLLLGDLPACKKTLDECEKLLGEQDTVEPIVNAGFYGVAGDYHKVKAEYGPYFKNSLLYLACIDSETELVPEDRVARAHDLCIAALLGETIYNFGELLQHPILQCLAGTEHAWIKDLISAFNAGEIGKFESLSTNFANEPILAQSIAFLRQKICLMALIQTAFSRPRDGASRLMTFQQIGEATRLPVYEVEHLLMKALSLSLIRGSLDQVSSTVDITWVQPRVLEGSQLDTLATQFKAWTAAVGKTEQNVDELRGEARQLVAAS